MQSSADCDEVVEGTYHVRAAQQAMMETFRTTCFMDAYGRLNILSSTQIVYHVRRIISNALGIPKSRIRVSKPRIGGGFGAKQSVVAELFPKICYVEDRESIEDDLYERRITDCIVSKT